MGSLAFIFKPKRYTTMQRASEERGMEGGKGAVGSRIKVVVGGEGWLLHIGPARAMAGDHTRAKSKG